jgi:hypothetical protein
MFIRPPPTTMTLGAGIMYSVVDSGQVELEECKDLKKEMCREMNSD